MRKFTDSQLETLRKFKRVEDKRYHHTHESDVVIDTRDTTSTDVAGDKVKSLLKIAKTCKDLIKSGALDRYYLEKQALTKEIFNENKESNENSNETNEQ